MRTGTHESGIECWWLTPGERALVHPELAALRTWHPAPEQAIAARAGCTIGVEGRAPLRQAVLSALTTARLRIVEGNVAEVVILANVDSAFDTRSVRGSQVLLPVRTSAAHATVGPIVIPGKSACLECLTMHEYDAAGGHAPPGSRPEIDSCDPVLAMVAVTAAVAHVRGWIDDPPGRLGTQIAFSLPDLRPRTRRVPAHPGCGCCWQR